MRYVYKLVIDNGEGQPLAIKFFSSHKVALDHARKRYKDCDYVVEEVNVYTANDFKKKKPIPVHPWGGPDTPERGPLSRIEELKKLKRREMNGHDR